jgi:hypothetical protein
LGLRFSRGFWIQKKLPRAAVDPRGRTILIADAHRGDGQRFIVRANEKLTGFWNRNRRLALAANCFDKQARFFQNSASLSQS